MEIIEIKENNEQFKKFLNDNEHLIFHTLSYKKFIEEAFGSRYFFLAAVDKEEIKTILPLVEVKSRLFGNKVISTAYLEYGGFAGDENYAGGIIDFVNSKFKRHNNYLEIRGGLAGFDSVLSSKTVKQNRYKRFVLKLGSMPRSSGEILNLPNQKNKEIILSTFGNVRFSSGSVPAVKCFRSNIQKSKRKAINKAKKKGVVVKDVPFSDLNKFYDLYCENMRHFGSPPYSKKYFISFYNNIINKGLGKIYGAYEKQKLVAALLGFCHQDRVHILIAVSDTKFQENRPNDAVHSEFIEWAIEKGFKWFDFGRVREESGQFEYKKKWGPELFDLPSYFLLWKTREVPEVDPSSYGLAVAVWKKVPLFLTRMVGPWLRKGLGI